MARVVRAVINEGRSKLLYLNTVHINETDTEEIAPLPFTLSQNPRRDSYAQSETPLAYFSDEHGVHCINMYEGSPDCTSETVDNFFLVSKSYPQVKLPDQIKTA